jgi:hypothetical protein
MNEPPFKPVLKKAKKGYQGHPVATVAFYGPDDTYATKVAVCIVMEERAEPATLERWKVEGGDIRVNSRVGKQVSEFISSHGVRTIVATAGIIGCPHEEGIDYPTGEACRRCPFWASRDRYAGRTT